MLQQNNVASVTLVPTINTAQGTFAYSFDTKGFDYAKVNLLYGTTATNGTHIQSVAFNESDTLTAATSMAATVAALGAGTATAATAANTLPAIAVTNLGGSFEWGIDLRKRKRYIGIYVTTGTTTHYMAGLVTLSKAEISCDTTTTKQVTENSNTAVRGCAMFVTA